jgi:hypothetical protein
MRSALISISVATRIAVSLAWPQGRTARARSVNSKGSLSPGKVFDLIRIQRLTHHEAALVVGASQNTVQRRLNHARLLLADLRPHQGPGITDQESTATPAHCPLGS